MDLGLKLIGDDCLRQVSEPVKEITNELFDFCDDLLDVMKESQGIGIAAPQVGRNIRLIIVQIKDGPAQVMINPRISWTSEKKVVLPEGCLSIPNEHRRIERPESIRVKFQDLEGDHKYWKLSGFDARVVLHEYDHLEGRLMTDHVAEE